MQAIHAMVDDVRRLYNVRRFSLARMSPPDLPPPPRHGRLPAAWKPLATTNTRGNVAGSGLNGVILNLAPATGVGRHEVTR